MKNKRLIFILLNCFLGASFVSAQSPTVYYISFKSTEQVQSNPVKTYSQDSISTSAKEKISIFPQIRYHYLSHKPYKII